ncbi:hypothetical protein O181_008666 [Austropuccinia psidii MF-1]|uniref:Retroviral polymerase SH3-like domain-containing protein n=1 Tax=Austropuccinia psidii MF-1 TaxID=1389203 RepID=A0A9Q3BQA3_9BASI|nr:hypothetical protein [Austropuccinia psidii MF-1]
MLNATNLTKQYWAEAINTATFISNLTPTTPRNNQSPAAIWNNNQPTLTKLRVFGCQAIKFKIKKECSWKLDQRGQEGIMLGYDNENTAYQILQLQDRKIIIRRHFKFNKKIFPKISTNTSHEEKWKGITEEQSKIATASITNNNHTIETETESQQSIQEINENRENNEGRNTSRQEYQDNNEHRQHIKIIGPRHPTIINSDLNKLNILTYNRGARVSTPLTPQDHLKPVMDQEIQEFNKLKINYISAIGSINFLSTATRTDLSFAVSALSQYLENQGIKHWKAFNHVLKYLQGTQDIGLHYIRSNKKGIKAFSDADWGNCRISRRSITGYLACLHDNLVIWKTKKQPSVSISTSEAEYKALCDLTSELLWFKQW